MGVLFPLASTMHTCSQPCILVEPLDVQWLQAVAAACMARHIVTAVAAAGGGSWWLSVRLHSRTRWRLPAPLCYVAHKLGFSVVHFPGGFD